MWWRIIFISLAYVLLAAHFLRFGQMPLAITCVMLPWLLLLKNNIITRVIQLGLIVATVMVWGVSTYQYIDMRITMHEPWYTLAIIMGSVIAFSLFASYCFNGLVNPPRAKNCLFR
ncbi:hypothetical protein A9267_04290 [Shewanella sp. UCD-FRSSP16_17]|uniref:hypothetical protein n=1 Tax=unclassified Shewanella TaxID=196818 RepID=UPI0007EEC848|nr:MULTISPECIES: hypothetical protein [unclassified Shewanella]MBQ4888245.1 hypothetical protein [Shewanella sp. MMG014]OBT11839.1 hypothetical protein A9267_04290 [Shewanella sp. UCD-FRSSP16_17]